MSAVTVWCLLHMLQTVKFQLKRLFESTGSILSIHFTSKAKVAKHTAFCLDFQGSDDGITNVVS